MALEESVNFGIHPAQTVEVADVTDSRLTRLQAALGSITELRQSAVTDAIPVGARVDRLASALNRLHTNSVVVDGEQVAITASNEADSDGLKTLSESQAVLVQEHFGLALHIASRFGNRGEALEDLRQVACIGLIKAATGYDPEYGAEFSQYAGVTIEGEIKRHFRDKTWAVKVPREVKELSHRLTSTTQKLMSTLNRQPTIEELAEAMSVDAQTVSMAMQAQKNYRTASLDAPNTHNEDLSAMDYIGQEEIDYERIETSILVEDLLATLDPREALILRARSGLPPFDAECSQEEIGELLGISQMQVSRLCNKALLKLSTLVTEADLY